MLLAALQPEDPFAAELLHLFLISRDQGWVPRTRRSLPLRSDTLNRISEVLGTYLVPVLLFHGTDDAGAEGIRLHGFAVSHVGDSQGRSWLTRDPSWSDTAGTTVTMFVLVEMPDEVANEYRYHFGPNDPHPQDHLVPFEVLNRYRPFTFLPASEVAPPV